VKSAAATTATDAHESGRPASRVAQSPPGDSGGRGGLLADLIAASARGDQRSFQRLYKATSGVLFGMALRMLKRRDWAEEVLQESFISVWRHAAGYDQSKGAPMTWLIRIVRNQALDWIHPSRPDGFERKHAQAADAGDDTLAALVGDHHTDGGAELAQYALQAERISACLAALDGRQRQSLVLVFFHGLSHADLARHLRQPLGTVKAWVRRGLARLGSCLAGTT
jgi:RNA polymerase sigma-70 factor (ECF subfamily)